MVLGHRYFVALNLTWKNLGISRGDISHQSSFLLCCFPKGRGCGSGSRGMAAGNEVKTLRRLTQSFSFHLLQVPHGY